MSSEVITRNDLIAIFTELGQPFTPLAYYPIGSKYETTDSDFDPNTAWGGTWVPSDEVQLVAYAECTSFPTISVSKNCKNIARSGYASTGSWQFTFDKPMLNNNYLVFVSGECSGIGSEIIGIWSKTVNKFWFDFTNHNGSAVDPSIAHIMVYGHLDEPESFIWHRIA